MDDIPDLEEKRIIIPKLNDIPEIENMEIEHFVVVKEKKSCFEKIFLTPRILWFSSMLLLAPTLYALYFYRIFFAIIYGGLWLTSILNWNDPIEYSNINMIDRVMCQIVLWSSVASVIYYKFSFVYYILFVLISLCFLCSMVLSNKHKTMWIPSHLLLHLITIMGGFMLIDDCYEINCSPFTDFYKNATH
jgi:hypothetical protein